MTQEEFDTLIPLHKKLKKEVNELFDYIVKRCYRLLEWGDYSCFVDFDMDDKELWIRYNNSGSYCDDYNEFYIPLGDFINRPKEYIDDVAQEYENRLKKKEEERQEQIEKHEREELKRLKEKYEK